VGAVWFRKEVGGREAGGAEGAAGRGVGILTGLLTRLLTWLFPGKPSPSFSGTNGGGELVGLAADGCKHSLVAADVLLAKALVVGETVFRIRGRRHS
jgi:hypothetical protein